MFPTHATPDDFRAACTKDLLDLFFPDSPDIVHDAYVDGIRTVFPTVARTPEERQLLAAAELVRRAAGARVMHAPTVAGPDLQDFLSYHFLSRETEVLTAFWLDTGHRVIATDDLSSGTVDAIDLHPRQVVTIALKRNAAAVILAQNCPSGIPSPAPSDIESAGRVRDALGLVGVLLVDHVLVSGRNTFSLKQNKLI